MGRSNIAVPSIYKEVHTYSVTYCNQRHNGQLKNFDWEGILFSAAKGKKPTLKYIFQSPYNSLGGREFN